MTKYTLNHNLEVLANNHYKAGNHKAQVYAVDAALRSVNLYTKTTNMPDGTLISVDLVMRDEVPDMTWHVIIPRDTYGYEVAYSCNGTPKVVGIVSTIAGVIAMVTSRTKFHSM